MSWTFHDRRSVNNTRALLDDHFESFAMVDDAGGAVCFYLPLGTPDSRRSHMITQIKLAATLASSFVLGCISFGALHAETKESPAFWVTETLEVSDQAAFLNVIKAVPATLQPFDGKYIVLGGKIAPGEGSPPRRITIVAFDSLEKAQQWFNSPVATATRAEAQKFAKIRSYFVEGVAK
jgi:uncharacterized protein (DUF1330 family)